MILQKPALATNYRNSFTCTLQHFDSETGPWVSQRSEVSLPRSSFYSYFLTDLKKNTNFIRMETIKLAHFVLKRETPKQQGERELGKWGRFGISSPWGQYVPAAGYLFLSCASVKSVISWKANNIAHILGSSQECCRQKSSQETKGVKREIGGKDREGNHCT